VRAKKQRQKRRQGRRKRKKKSKCLESISFKVEIHAPHQIKKLFWMGFQIISHTFFDHKRKICVSLNSYCRIDFFLFLDGFLFVQFIKVANIMILALEKVLLNVGNNSSRNVSDSFLKTICSNSFVALKKWQLMGITVWSIMLHKAELEVFRRLVRF
jgi:hypothetical protein